MKVNSGEPILKKTKTTKSGKVCLILLKKGEKFYKIFKVQFDKKGDIYFFNPYHKFNSAKVFTTHIDYNSEITKSFKKKMKSFSFKSKERPKFSYHNSGFIQFSGAGILSGREADGTIKGFGFESTSIKDIYKGDFTIGPRLVLQISKFEECFESIDMTKSQKYDCLIFDYESVISRKQKETKGNQYLEEVIVFEIFLYPYIYQIYKHYEDYPFSDKDIFLKTYYLPDSVINNNIALGFNLSKIKFSFNKKNKDLPLNGWYMMGFSSGKKDIEGFGEQLHICYPEDIF